MKSGLKMVLLALCGAAIAASSGCGRVDNFDERHHRIMQVWEHDLRALNDDWDSFWLVDRPSRLTRYPVD